MLLSVITGQFLELLTLFIIVFIHELGHVCAALLLGVTVKSVQLLPFGGVAVMEDHGRLTAGREIAIAFAGPLQNGIMIVMALALQHLGSGSGAFLAYFIQANAIIALFNFCRCFRSTGQDRPGCAQHASALLLHSALERESEHCGKRACHLICAAASGSRGRTPVESAYDRSISALFQYYGPAEFALPLSRFLMNREAAYERYLRLGSAAQPIVAFSAKPLDDILRLFKRNQYHFIYVMNDDKNVVAVVPEQRLISSYFGM